MLTLIFESHGTTTDNEHKISSGWNDVSLSQLGVKQAQELGERYEDQTLAAIFCSDLERSYKTAELAFGDKYPIVKDARLRECNYGNMNGAPKQEVEAYKATAITTPYPNGESYADTSKRMKAFLDDLLRSYDDKTVMVIGHRATQYGLEEWVNGIELKETVLAPWQWQAGWEYELTQDKLGVTERGYNA
ncbi:MAG TPA: histidine phosphatase family protein [Candidatus Saccharimonadales bacterium]|nr:histidine phosphatase family protein [Candidatus Saccharimonadales bacterium]